MNLWQLMEIPADELGRETAVRVRIGGNAEAMDQAMAEEMADLIRERNRSGRSTCLIVPVGPVGQYRRLAELIAGEALDCSRVTFINMDEFLTDAGDYLDVEHPLSFRGFMQRSFYDLLPPEAGFRSENHVFPSPEDPEGMTRVIRERGGVDACFGGIGLNGHIAFNEPRPDLDLGAFMELPTRTLSIAPESRAHMAVNLSCSIDLIPRRAVTVGMKEILGAERLSFYANRPWQRGIVRQLLHGPVTPQCPASCLQRHPDARLTVADFVAEGREVRLR